MDFTKSKGNLTELECIMKFIEWGFDVSIPYGDCCKYDFIADINGKLLRFQCKSSAHPQKDGRVDENAIMIRTTSQTTNTQKTVRHRYTQEQIDYFATSFQGKVYVIPVTECSTTKTLRFKPPLNNNKIYNYAEDYLMENVFADEIDVNFKDYSYTSTGQIEIKKELAVKKYYCTNCGKEISTKTAKLCVDCSRELSRKAERPTRDELKHLIRTTPFLQIGKLFGVTDNAIRKWCKAMDLPTKKTEIKTFSDEEWQKI